jgi:hypothetical protein
VTLQLITQTQTCPYAYGGDCKHIVATLLAWVGEPGSFQPPLAIKALLKKRSKAELITLLLKGIDIYPTWLRIWLWRVRRFCWLTRPLWSATCLSS